MNTFKRRLFLLPSLAAITVLIGEVSVQAAPANSIPSYVGVAGNIGLSGGETSLGTGNVAVISKLKLNHNVSFRPGVVFGDNTTVLLPLTYDFSWQLTPLSVSPYVGTGLAINTGNNSEVGGLLTAGVDVPLTSQFTANVGVNAGFVNNTSVGLAIGVGYNF